MIGVIAAMSENQIIGDAGGIPWHSPVDLKRFKRITEGSIVVMGRKTWESIGSKPLPGRMNYIFSTSVVTESASGASFRFVNLDPAGFVDFVSGTLTNRADLWVIGGAEIYQQMLPHADVCELTVVEGEYQGDTLFPYSLLLEHYDKESITQPVPPYDGPNVTFETWRRKSG